MPVDRIRDFRRRLQRAAAEVEIETPHGVALLAPSIRDVYDANYLSVEEATVSAAELAAEAEVSLEDHFHRRVIVEQGTPGLAADFERLGFGLATHLVLAHQASLDRRVDTSMVREVSLDDLAAVRHATTVAEPWGDDEIARQLDGAKRLIAAAVPTRFFAADVDGEVAAYCEVRSAGGTAQIEDVETVERFRGRGLGRAIVQHALEQALRDHDVVYLEALADDWPRELYAKLGFRVVDRRDFYTRLPHPSTRLRLRTPRLVLRRATIAELRELYRVAEAGVHDPAEMPFEVPWTDTLNEADFLAHLTEETGRDLRLVVFHEGKPIGVQAIDVRLPRVSTGSWLGASYQGRGFGTEMRTAVLAFAFDHLRAEVAVSGAVAGNDRSLGVSRKLGYRVTGAHDVSPRGEPVEHTDLELRREDFRPPVPVHVEGAAQVLPLFAS